MLKFGGLEAMKQDSRAEGDLQLIENLVQDVRFVLRMLRKNISRILRCSSDELTGGQDLVMA
jgi:hypothetical protein